MCVDVRPPALFFKYMYQESACPKSKNKKLGSGGSVFVGCVWCWCLWIQKMSADCAFTSGLLELASADEIEMFDAHNPKLCAKLG